MIKTLLGTYGDSELDNHSVTNLGSDKLYITGGRYSKGEASDQAVEFNLKTCQARELPRMERRRCGHSSLIHGDKLCVIGG